MDNDDPALTTRDAPPRREVNPQATRHDGTPTGDTQATRRDDLVTGTRRDHPIPGQEFHPSPATLGALQGRFSVVGELAAQGAEADLLLVTDPAGARFVIKIFRRGIRPDPSVWQAFAALTSPHIVHIVETGHTNGRDYELLEYVPGGNLRELAARSPGALPARSLHETVVQLSDAMQCLHAAGIVHRDLKPENVLVRAVTPLNLAVTDFGLSKTLDQSMVFASSSRTLAYAAPESLSGQVSPARDWWSLGMIVRELATGRRPFSGLTEAAVIDHLATRPIGVDDIRDPRIRLLCRGLLTRDPRRRWGSAQVQAWLRGESPTVAQEFAQPRGRAGKALPFNGELYRDKQSLAAALVTHWELAVQVFFRHAAGGHSEAWWTLRDWMAQFDDPDTDDIAGRIELVDTHLVGGLPADVKLLHLLRWLDPAMPPHLLGRRVSMADLSTLFSAAQDSSAPDHAVSCSIGTMLWNYRLLPVLASFGAPERPNLLTRVDDRWRELAQEWTHRTAEIRAEQPQLSVLLPPLTPRVDPKDREAATVLLSLLALAAYDCDPRNQPDTASAFAHAATQTKSLVTEPLEWFTRLAESSSSSPVAQLVAVRAAGAAIAQADQARRTRELREQQAERRRQDWADSEQLRLDRRPAMVGKAVLICLLALPLWLGASWLAVHIHQLGDWSIFRGRAVKHDPLSLFIYLSIGTWLAHTLIEALLAIRQGRDYVVNGVLFAIGNGLRALGGFFGGIGYSIANSATRFGPAGALASVLVLIIAPLLLITSAVGLGLIFYVVPAWVAFTACVVASHAIAAAIRVRRWQRELNLLRKQTLGIAHISEADV